MKITAEKRKLAGIVAFLLLYLALSQQVYSATTQLTIGQVNTGSFGNNAPGATGDSELIATFQHTGSSLTLSMDTFDIDFSDEIEVLLNGYTLGFLDKTANNSTGTSRFDVPENILLAGANTLRIVQYRPRWTWGVSRLLLATTATTTTEPVSPGAGNFDSVLVIGQADNNAYGYRFNGVNSNRDSLTFQFVGSTSDLELTMTTYDIDFTDEVKWQLNGSDQGFLNKTANNQFGTSRFSIPANQQLAGTNLLTFSQKVSGWKWGISEVKLSENGQTPTTPTPSTPTQPTQPTQPTENRLVLGVTDNGRYGFRYQGVSTHREEYRTVFTGSGKSLTLTLNGFDIDFVDEVSVLLNGNQIGNLARTGNNSSGSTSVQLPANTLLTGDNELRFVQKQPGWSWGVTKLLIVEAGPQQSDPPSTTSPELTLDSLNPTAYGYRFNGVNSHRDILELSFNSAGTDLLLSVLAYDIDFDDEVKVSVNGSQLGYLGKTANNQFLASELTIPADAQQTGTNLLQFEQRQPGWIWGVTDILLTPINESNPSIEVPDSPESPQVPAEPANPTGSNGQTLPDLSKYDNVFEDNFDGSTLDAARWNTALLWGPYLPINNEQQLYVDTLGIHRGTSNSPFTVSNGTLKITATPTGSIVAPPTRPDEDDPIWDQYPEYRFNAPSTDGPGYDPANVDYLSGIITSYESFKMTHGYVETRAKLPAGRGLWPAFWALNTHYVEQSPEIDVMEFLGQDKDTIYHTYHYFEPANNWRQISTPSFTTISPDWTQDFHVFGMEWSPRKITWYVDGQQVRQITDADYIISKQAMYLLANLAVGGNWPGAPDNSTQFPATYEIDYIRAYKKKAPDPVNLSRDFQLMFFDEFNGNSLNENKWTSHFLWGPYLPINNEEQYYVDALGSDKNKGYSPFTVANGVLTITAATSEASGAQIPPSGIPNINSSIWQDYAEFRRNELYQPPAYTSGLLTSHEAFQFVHGYAEIRARIPAGDGLWPAFWLLNAYYVGELPEIDVMEVRGERPGEVVHSFHRSLAGGVVDSTSFSTSGGTGAEGYADDFHTYGVHWKHNKITWYIDGQAVHTYAGEDVPYQLMYLIMNLAVGGDFNNKPVDESLFPATMDIDYVRVYQVKD